MFLYTNALAGVPIVTVDLRNTSRMCSACGHGEKANQARQEKLLGVSCEMGLNADKNAALTIKALATRKMAMELKGAISQPESPSH